MHEILDYNDADNNTQLRNGEVVFLRPKKNKAETESHKVKDGETMRSVAQLYGIKIKKLYRMNKLDEGAEPKEGDVLYLNKSLFFGKVMN